MIATVYEVTRRFPITERFALVQQLQRAAVSVASNIAEGHARQYRREFLQSLYIARGSLAEVDTQLTVSRRLGYVQEAAFVDASEVVAEVGRLLEGLIRALTPGPRPLTPSATAGSQSTHPRTSRFPS